MQQKLDSTEWRVCCVALPGPRLGWQIKVYVRRLMGENGAPGEWRLVRDVEYQAPMGPLKSTYWKDMLKAAAH